MATIKPILKVNRDGSKWKNLREVLTNANIDGIRRIFITADGNTSAKINLSQSSTEDKWIKVYDDKLVKCEFTVSVRPVVDVQGNWNSRAWSNGRKRVLKPVKEDRVGRIKGKRDPDDDRLFLLRTGNPEAEIDGKGTLIVRGDSPRVYVDGPWQDVEFSADIFVGNNVKEVYLVARSNHEDRNRDDEDLNGFGGYYLYLNFEKQKIFFKKELKHLDKPRSGYSKRLNVEDIDFPKKTWVNAEVRITNIGDDRVKVEGHFNHKKRTEMIDNGSIKCGEISNTEPYLKKAKWCFIRTNKPNDVRYRNVSITKL